MINNAYSAYKRQSVTTMTPIEIIVKLYDECDRQLNRAIYFIEKKGYEDANNALKKSSDIVDSLQSSLNMDIPMSKNLDSLYEYFNREILEANMKKDVEKIKAILPQINELRNAFSQISKMSREQIQHQALNKPIAN